MIKNLAFISFILFSIFLIMFVKDQYKLPLVKEIIFWRSYPILKLNTRLTIFIPIGKYFFLKLAILSFILLLFSFLNPAQRDIQTSILLLVVEMLLNVFVWFYEILINKKSIKLIIAFKFPKCLIDFLQLK